ncbi:hypothetical protein [Nostoc sp. C117]|uniref:hypothetical protein n=1 Tax=Nostoc sp. C117 TaxID=3349875 RepID=UPI00370D0AD5
MKTADEIEQAERNKRLSSMIAAEREAQKRSPCIVEIDSFRHCQAEITQEGAEL